MRTPSNTKAWRSNVVRPFFSTPARAARFFAAPTPVVQTKLTMGSQGDRFEQEADSMANAVMRTGEPGALTDTPHDALVQRLPITLISPRREGGEVSPPPNMESRLDASRGGGSSLPASTREFMESRFDHDFSGVRVHTGTNSDQLNRDVHSLAFTSGSDIYFRAGQCRPDTDSGQHLLAHELTHVVQQRDDPQPGMLSRAPAAYEDCSEATTGEKNWKPILDQALKRADDFVDAALCALARDPATEPASSAYPLALQRHFLGSSFDLRKTLLANFIKIRGELKREKIRCVKTDEDQSTCVSDKGLAGAFASKGQDWLCTTFWSYINRNCMAECLIHEAAHLIGLGIGTPHPPYRGGDDYPFGGKAPTTGQTTAQRMDNPDAYAYFAMHVWREIDSECYVTAELIQVSDQPPATTPPTSPGDKK